MSQLEFDHIYREHLDFVWRCLKSRGVPESSLEDAAHEVFIVLHRKLHEYDGRASVRTWIYGFVRKIAANVRRGIERAERRSRIQPLPMHESEDLDGEISRAEAARVVAQFLDTLDTNCREAFHLSQIEGFTGPEIASMTDTNVHTIHARIRAGRRRFETFLRDRNLGPTASSTPRRTATHSPRRLPELRYCPSGEPSHG